MKLNSESEIKLLDEKTIFKSNSHVLYKGSGRVQK